MTSQEGYRKFGLKFFFFFDLLSLPTLALELFIGYSEYSEKRFCQPVMEETSAPQAQGQKHTTSGQTQKGTQNKLLLKPGADPGRE